MAVEKDQSAWLPEPPPPRPPRRDAAIDAALRRFDGIDEPARGARERRPSWARTHRPQMAVMVSALLLMIVGIPAALIGLRNSPSPPQSSPPPVAAYETKCAGQNCPSAPPPPAQRAPAVRYEPTETPPPMVSPAVPPPALKSSAEEHGVLAKDAPEAKAARTEVAAPPPATADMASAPPPPPAPSLQSAPANVAERAMGQSIVVTGARVAKPSDPAIDPTYKVFLSRLQRAVRSNDRQAVIALIGFPLRVNTEGGAKVYPDAQSVERDFNRIFTLRVRRAILGQRANRLFVRDQGAMIGSGEVWFDFSCPNVACSPAGPVAIKAVNP